MLSHSEVIEAFGGVRPLAEAIGVDPKRAIHWPKRGIPAKYWPRVEEVAAKHGVTIAGRPVTARALVPVEQCTV